MSEPEAAAPPEPVAWLWVGHNGHRQAFVTKPPPSMLRDPNCTPLYPAAAPREPIPDRVMVTLARALKACGVSAADGYAIAEVFVRFWPTSEPEK